MSLATIRLFGKITGRDFIRKDREVFTSLFLVTFS